MSGMRGRKKTSSGETQGNSGVNKTDNSKSAKTSRKGRKANRRNSAPVAESFDEAKWRAEQDLRALTEAKDVLDSPGRVKAAKNIAQERVEVARAAAESIDNL